MHGFRPERVRQFQLPQVGSRPYGAVGRQVVHKCLMHIAWIEKAALLSGEALMPSRRHYWADATQVLDRVILIHMFIVSSAKVPKQTIRDVLVYLPYSFILSY